MSDENGRHVSDWPECRCGKPRNDDIHEVSKIVLPGTVFDGSTGNIPRRPDGWPLCPFCGEDELADLAHQTARSDGDLFCYRCARVTVRAVRLAFHPEIRLW